MKKNKLIDFSIFFWIVFVTFLYFFYRAIDFLALRGLI